MSVRDIENRVLCNAPGNMVISVKSLNGIVDKHFIAHKHTPLRKLMNAYCHLYRVPVRAINFLYKSRLITENDTPESLGIVNGEILDVANAQNGPLIALPHEDTSNHIMINVLSIGENRSECSFFLLRTTPVISLLIHHYKRFGITERAQRFTYRRTIISHNDTAITLGMVDGDTLKIVYAEYAG